MYKSNRRKSNQRPVPYDISSSLTSNRKSGQFISPIINLEASMTAGRSSTDKPSNLLNEPKSTKIVDKSLNSSKQTSDTPNDNQQSMINKENIKDTNKEILINKENADKINEEAETGQLIDQPRSTQDDDFDSEFDKLFHGSSLEDKLNKEFPTTSIRVNEKINDNLDDNLDDLDDNLDDNLNDELVASNYLEDGEELFDSDAINEMSDNDSNQLNDRIQSEVDELFQQEANESLDFDNELDTTLLYDGDKSDDFELVMPQATQFNESGNEFKTAGGSEIKISMTVEQQRARAKRLGFYDSFS